MNHYAQEDLGRLEAERRDAWAMPLAAIDPSDRRLFEHNTHFPYFERLRREDPVHFHEASYSGPFWSVTRYEDIREIDQTHEVFSSEPSVTFAEGDVTQANFITMDQPRHHQQRKAVAPVTGPTNLASMESLIRSRACAILDSLPVGEPFSWVDRVAIELTTQMLATLLDFPFEDRRKLTRWSDVATSSTDSGVNESKASRHAELMECFETFRALWEERQKDPSGNDLLSMLIRSEDTRNMSPSEFFGNVILLIVGGNDTTRNSITGGVLALNQYPGEFEKVKADHSLIPNMVSEIIRWQTPVLYMRRTALADYELRGKTIRAGDKVAMWYISGNRDETVFDHAHDLQIDRPNARSHLSFGYGIHRCMGNRLAEMQLRVLWEELLARFDRIEVASPPERYRSNLIRGYREMQVVLHAQS
ncbi:MAG: cytochrome P450 [Gammaproteobacteria bacterium]|nr:cytochrome P450 [Gammaproteobacteria bacterium]